MIQEIELSDFLRVHFGKDRQIATLVTEPATVFGSVKNWFESHALAHICAALDPGKVFEIGTFQGHSTTTLALNSKSDGTVFSLSLPRTAQSSELSGDTQFADNSGILIFDEQKFRFVREKIRPLEGDSATFDFSVYAGSIDLVFVDGGHTYQDISNDTEKAELMLSANGLIVWHDYEIAMGGVYRFLNERAESRDLFQIRETTFVAELIEGSPD